MAFQMSPNSNPVPINPRDAFYSSQTVFEFFDINKESIPCKSMKSTKNPKPSHLNQPNIPNTQ